MEEPDPTARPAIDLNTASADELEDLPGIGPAKAQAIVAYRSEHGPFASLDALIRVPGIGQKTVEKIREKVETAQ